MVWGGGPRCQGACTCACEYCKNGSCTSGQGRPGLLEAEATEEVTTKKVAEKETCTNSNVCTMGWGPGIKCQAGCTCQCDYCKNGSCAPSGPWGPGLLEAEATEEVATKEVAEKETCTNSNVCTMGWGGGPRCQGACTCACEYCKNGSCAPSGPWGPGLLEAEAT